MTYPKWLTVGIAGRSARKPTLLLATQYLLSEARKNGDSELSFVEAKVLAESWWIEPPSNPDIKILRTKSVRGEAIKIISEIPLKKIFNFTPNEKFTKRIIQIGNFKLGDKVSSVFNPRKMNISSFYVQNGIAFARNRKGRIEELNNLYPNA